MASSSTLILSAYTPVTVSNTAWALLAEIDKEEVISNSVAARTLLKRVMAIGLVSMGIIAAAASEELNAQASQLKALVNDLVRLVSGKEK